MATPSSPRRPSRILESSRREALLVTCMWTIAMAYTVGYCALFGYERSPEEARYVLGFPDWVFWGIVTPWLVCVVTGILFAYFVMRDEDLETLKSPEEELAARDERPASVAVAQSSRGGHDA